MGQSREPIRNHVHDGAPVVPFPVPNSDAGLVAALRSGHRDAGRALCDRYSEELLKVATRIIGPDQGVRSLVIGSLRRATEEIHDLQDPKSLRLWLLRRLVKAARGRLRTQYLRRWFTGGSAESWFDGVRCSEQLIETYCAMNGLGIEQRLVFSLIVLHSMRLADAAAVLGTTTQKTNRRVSEALLAFSKLCGTKFPALMQRHRSHASLGAEVAREQDRLMGDRRIHELDLQRRTSGTRTRLVTRRRKLGWALALAPFLVVPASAAAAALAMHYRAVTYQIQDEGALAIGSLPLGRRVVASAGQSKAITFSDGATMVLAPNARARILGVNHRGATSTVESGSVSLSIADPHRSEYVMAVGPFTVELTQGRADLAWDPSKEKLDLAVHQGSVVLSGCQFGTGIALHRSKSLQAFCRATADFE